MSHGHNKHKGFSQTSKRFDGSLKEEHQRNRSTQHSANTAKESLEEKSPKDSTSVGRKTSQAT
ncbi:hypothetical protein D3C87_987470 [compost metagenome]